jgi:hypothetical protein
MNKKLGELEASGKYVFHGSAKGDIASLEPRQGTHEGNPDGQPAVSATPYLEFAIFRAIVNKNNIPFNHSNRFGFNQNKEKEIEFRIYPKAALEACKDKKGFVYVFDRKDFSPYSRIGKPSESHMEWRSYKPVKPIEIIPVSFDDFPSEDKIQILE